LRGDSPASIAAVAAPERRRAGSCFVVATRNRPDHLLEAIRSLVAQTILPAELCIVDSSDETPARAEIERLSQEAGIWLDYIHPAPTGLTLQRNLGVDRTSGDPVFFIDDDVWMQPDVHEEVLAEYDRWGAELGGVRGTWLEPPTASRLSTLWRRFFGMETWRAEASGRMRPGFFTDVITTSAEPRRVESFVGWFMSFRRDVFDDERFDENLAEYGFKEDADFSYRVAKRGRVLMQTPRAKIQHAKTSDQRLSPHELQRMNIANHLYLHRKNMPQTFNYKAALWWGMAGTFILNVGKSIETRDTGWATGMIAGAWDQLSRRKRITAG
jgi:GT2 family glycosyltransferase